MEIQQIMKRLDESRKAESEGIKTASAAPSKQPSAPNSDVLRQALHTALSSAPDSTKTAAADKQPEPVGDLLKVAEDLLTAEEDLMLKQATLLGQAFGEGVVSRLAQYEQAIQQMQPAKTAGVSDPVPDNLVDQIKTAANDPQFAKFAQENPDLVKEAFDLGYQQQMQQLVKQANDEFTQGWQDAMTEVHKVASASYKNGAYTINTVLRELQQSA